MSTWFQSCGLSRFFIFNITLGFQLLRIPIVDLTMHAIKTAIKAENMESSRVPGISEAQVDSVDRSSESELKHHTRRSSSIRQEQEDKLYTPRMPPIPPGAPLVMTSPSTEFYALEQTFSSSGSSSPNRAIPSPGPISISSIEVSPSATGLGVQVPTRLPPEATLDNPAPAALRFRNVQNESVNDTDDMGTNHLRMLVDGYKKSVVCALIRSEIQNAENAAENSHSDAPSSSTSSSSHLPPDSRNSAIALPLIQRTLSAISMIPTSLAQYPRHRVPIWTQFWILCGRTFKNLFRNPQLLQTHYLISAFVALLCGGLFWGLKNDIGGFQVNFI
jgi:hypothetical protein